MESYICPACQGVVNSARREAHDRFWCPAAERPTEDDDTDDEGEDQPLSKELGGARAALSSLCQETIAVTFGSLPSLVLTFEQYDIWGPSDTGGALWYGDRVMAEYVASGGLGSSRGGADSGGLGGGTGSGGTVLVLGSGGVPLSGLVASALGWDVVLSDLGVVLEQTRKNVDRNVDPIMQARRELMPCDGGCEGPPSIHVTELPFGDQDSLTSALSLAGDQTSDRGRQLLVLCSDCIWKRALHEPLLKTIESALRRAAPPSAEAIVSFQTRNKHVERAFAECVRDRFPGLGMSPVDIGHVLPCVQWPPQVQEAVHCLDLVKEFFIYRLALRPEKPAAPDSAWRARPE